MIDEGHQRKNARERARRNIKAGRHPRETLIRVPNEPLRKRLLRMIVAGEITAAEAALNAGWVVRRSDRRGGVAGDAARLRRALGILPSDLRQRDGRRTRYVADELLYETAEVICHALHADPPAVGL